MSIDCPAAQFLKISEFMNIVHEHRLPGCAISEDF